MKRFLSSVKLTIILLLLLAALSILGTIIPQGEDPYTYVKIYGEGLTRVILNLNLDDMYHSIWFRFLLFLFGANLVFCSWIRLPKVFESLKKKRLLSLEDVKKISGFREASKEKMKSIQDSFGKPVFSEDGKFFFEKGKISILGPYITHLGILIVLIGGIVGSFWGIRGMVNILEGGEANYIVVRKGRKAFKKILPFVIKCEDFSISYYEGSKVPKEYKSVVEIKDYNGTVIKKGVIRVNHPLEVMGYTIYQASYGKVASGNFVVDVFSKKEGKKIKELKMRKGEKVEFLPGKEIKIAAFNPNFQGFGEAAHMIYYENGIPKDAFWILAHYPEYDRGRNSDYFFVLKGIGIKYYTGLEVSRSPGVNLVWLGCIIMSLGIFISFFIYHKRVWVVEEGDRIYVAGISNKNQEAFQYELERLLGEGHGK